MYEYELNKLLDEKLKELSDNPNGVIVDKFNAYKRLVGDGFADYDGKIFTINKKGRLFLKQGGYSDVKIDTELMSADITRLIIKGRMDERKNKANTLLHNVSIIIGIVVGIMMLVFAVLSYFKNN